MAPYIQPHRKAEPDKADHARVLRVPSLSVDSRKPEPPKEVEAAAIFSVRFGVASPRDERMRPNKAARRNPRGRLSRFCFHGLFSAPEVARP
jgi:hypothetical protein